MAVSGGRTGTHDGHAVLRCGTDTLQGFLARGCEGPSLFASSCDGTHHLLTCGHVQRTNSVVCSQACVVPHTWRKADTPACRTCETEESEMRIFREVEILDCMAAQIESLDGMAISPRDVDRLERLQTQLRHRRQEIGRELSQPVWREYQRVGVQQFLRNLRLRGGDERLGREYDLNFSDSAIWRTYSQYCIQKLREGTYGSYGGGMPHWDGNGSVIVGYAASNSSRSSSSSESLPGYNQSEILALSYSRTEIDEECQAFTNQASVDSYRCTCAEESLVRDSRALDLFQHRYLAGRIARMLTWATYVPADFEVIRDHVYQNHVDLSRMSDEMLEAIEWSFAGNDYLIEERVRAMVLCDQRWAAIYATHQESTRRMTGHQNANHQMTSEELCETLNSMVELEVNPVFETFLAVLNLEQSHTGAIPVVEGALQWSNATTIFELSFEQLDRLQRELAYYFHTLNLQQRRNRAHALVCCNVENARTWGTLYPGAYFTTTIEDASHRMLDIFESAIQARGYDPSLPFWEDTDQPGINSDMAHGNRFSTSERLRREIILKVTFDRSLVHVFYEHLVELSRRHSTRYFLNELNVTELWQLWQVLEAYALWMSHGNQTPRLVQDVDAFEEDESDFSSATLTVENSPRRRSSPDYDRVGTRSEPIILDDNEDEDDYRSIASDVLRN